VRVAPKKFMDEAHVKRSWDFSSPEGQKWHDRVLLVIAEQLPKTPWGDALEIGCSEGVFTSHLSSRCRSVQAYDISPVALSRAAERCAQYSNVHYELRDLAQEEIVGKYDLVFAMDILSCIRGRERFDRAVGKLVSALSEGGFLIYSDNSMPLEVQNSWGRRRWWDSVLAIMDPDDCVQYLEDRFGLMLVAREQYVSDPQGGRDQLLALFQKPTTSNLKTDASFKNR
jgi:predicted TPR repeat methyltransferase